MAPTLNPKFRCDLWPNIISHAVTVQLGLCHRACLLAQLADNAAADTESRGVL